MSGSLDDLMAELGIESTDTSEKSSTEKVEVQEEVAAVAEAKTDPLEGLVVGATEVPEPAPVKKPRGRPAKKAAAPKAEPVEVVEVPVEPTAPEPVEVATVEAEVTEVPTKADEAGEVRDIYILQDSQIINGAIYRKGQKITYTVGDKFYNSQTDRNGDNWLDLVRDPEAQYAYFGRLVVEADHWSGIPLGSVDGINHPGLALAISKFAREEYERGGAPLN